LRSPAVLGARESWLKDPRNHKLTIDFLRVMTEAQQFARDNAVVSKRALKKLTGVEDEALLQGSFEYYREAFPRSIRVNEKAMANALKFVEHPKDNQFDVRQSFENSFVDEAMKQ